MKGIHHIVVENKKLKYEFDIRRNITIIRGDSATGKTTLIEMLSEYQNNGDESGVYINSDCTISVANASNWKHFIEAGEDEIIFIDEGVKAISSQEFAETLKGADVYVVLITRDKLSNLPYSVDEIYGIRTSGRYAGLNKAYHEFYKIYTEPKKPNAIETVISEDSNSGNQFFRAIFKADVISAGGKTKIEKEIRMHKGENILVCADGAAFGSEMEAVTKLISMGFNITLYLPESFEWLILRADILDTKEVKDILEAPYNYADSKIYFSWERMFTDLLTNYSANTYLRYQKSKLNPAYTKGQIVEKIVDSLPKSIRKAVVQRAKLS